MNWWPCSNKITGLENELAKIRTGAGNSEERENQIAEALGKNR